MPEYDLRQEKFYWDKQIERHHVGKRIRRLARKEKYHPFIHLARKLKVSRKTIWALANGLTIASDDLKERIEKLEDGL